MVTVNWHVKRRYSLEKNKAVVQHSQHKAATLKASKSNDRKHSLGDGSSDTSCLLEENE